MLFNKNATVLADNGIQVFLACDIELILSMVYDYDYSDGTRKHRYSDIEVCEHWDISMGELERMKHLLSAEYNINADGRFKYKYYE